MYRNKKIRRVVAKFGGKSLADGERIHQAARAIAREVEGEVQIAVVASALGNTTDTLINITNQATEGKIKTREIDDILSMGERTSVRILSAALNAQGAKSRYFDPAEEDWPIITNDHFTNAEPILPECSRRIKKRVLPLLEQGIVPVIAGFIGKTLDGHVTTIGRGGSDTTAFVRKDLAPIKVEGLRFEEVHSVASNLLESLRVNGINFAGFFPITLGFLVFVDWSMKDTVLNLFEKTLEGKS